MKEKLTPYLRKMLGENSIRKQYLVSENPISLLESYNDPLMEDSHEVVKGLIHKYTNRALLKVSYQCAAHCRFCTRIRQIGNKAGTLNTEEIEQIFEYLKSHPEIQDVIISGGDPLYTPHLTFQLLEKIKLIESIKVIRIGSRMPFHAPEAFNSSAYNSLFQLIKQISGLKPFYILVHVEHLSELTSEAQIALKKLKSLGVTLLSQSVLLRGINDKIEVLDEMYTKLYHLGVIPYYIYHCDNVQGLEHFQVDKVKEKNLSIELRKRLSGIAVPLLVEDLENDYGKIPF